MTLRDPAAVPGGRRRAAFTLIETALALLAIGLGLLALFGLGRLGLQATKESEHDQRCALMADAVFETLREANMRFVDEGRTNINNLTWNQQWAMVTNSTIKIHFPTVADMSTSEDLYLMFGSIAKAYDEKALSLLDWNPLYSLQVVDKFASKIAEGVNLKQATLVIYPDGDTYSSEYRVFQTTLSNPGGLP